jgi:hypothetical protein
MICETGYTQINYDKIDSYIKDCGVKIFKKEYDSEKNILFIQTDSIRANDFSTFVFEPFTASIRISDYDKIDSLIRIRYKDKEILSSQRTDEDMYVLHSYITKNKKGDYISDRYVVLEYNRSLLLMMYSSIFGNSSLNFDRFECVIKKVKQAAHNRVESR